MSWQAYVDDNLIKSGQVSAAGIYDLQGNPWAYSAGFAAQIAEVAAVSAHFAAPTGLAATGATIAGIKYMFVRGEENAEIYVKKVSGLPRACLHPNPLPPSSAEVVS